MLKPTIFREYDIRGIAASELPDAGVELLGQALGTYLERYAGNKVALGRDTRLSSPRLHDALLRGLLESGCEVLDIGIVPTPVLYYSVLHFLADGGIMITGSHNPPEFNGFKVVAGTSTIYGDAIQAVRRLMEARDLASGPGSIKEVDAISPYVTEVASQFHFPRRIKVVVDAGNGVGGPAMHRILQNLNVDAIEMYFGMDGHFPNHHPDPTIPANLAALIGKVRSVGADLGIAFDGDADRIGAVDETGGVIYGDQLMILYGREILSRKPGATFIGEVKCSQLMYDELSARGGKPIMWKTGHSLIKAKMKECHAELAGEMSGHMFFADRYYGFDDALYAACRLIEIVAQSERALSAHFDGIPKTVTTPEIRFDCPDEIKFEVVRSSAEHFQARYPTLGVDGVRVLFPEGWGLIRASNTQPVLVLRFEAGTQALLDQYRSEVESVVARAVATVERSATQK